MSDLISRQYILDALAEYIEEYKEVDKEGTHDPKWCAMKEAEMVVKEAPSVESEIIHCKNCKHFGVDRYKKLTWCSRINYGYGYQADDFCSKAERRTDDCV